MKGVLVLLFALVSTINVRGQSARSLYYNEAWNLTKKDGAIYFRVCGFDSIRREFAGEFIRWIPGIQRRKCVRQRFTLPIHFGL
jgi:hypothetical protein